MPVCILTAVAVALDGIARVVVDVADVPEISCNTRGIAAVWIIDCLTRERRVIIITGQRALPSLQLAVHSQASSSTQSRIIFDCLGRELFGSGLGWLLEHKWGRWILWLVFPASSISDGCIIGKGIAETYAWRSGPVGWLKMSKARDYFDPNPFGNKEEYFSFKTAAEAPVKIRFEVLSELKEACYKSICRWEHWVYNALQLEI